MSFIRMCRRPSCCAAIRALLLILGLVLAQSAYADDFKLAGTCLVFDYDMSFLTGKTMRTSYAWRGACDISGYASGPGELLAFLNGQIDEDSTGIMVRGRLEGAAKTVSRDFVFYGTYRGGLRDGRGVLSRIDGSKLTYRYIGDFHQGLAAGYGVLDVGLRHYEGHFLAGLPDGRGTETGLRGGQHYHYEGDFLGGVWFGHGVLTWSRGDHYEGEFRRGFCEGQGSWSWPDGRRYLGRFIGGLPVGWGSMIFPDGTFINGQYARIKLVSGKAVAPNSAGLPIRASDYP